MIILFILVIDTVNYLRIGYYTGPQYIEYLTICTASQ